MYILYFTGVNELDEHNYEEGRLIDMYTDSGK